MSLQGERLNHGSMTVTVDTGHYDYRRFMPKTNGLAIEGHMPLSQSN
jgi:hypothetical protein